ncbi:hypothetical protein [Microbulbifer magnicolonia]|uniref:hypothetical protein n=1 Tax=Microbulbifer magnicolonia TaxID=3109744 RepID=UPI002B406C97|nr:hypothetical protein [Microbulbifer sp. GG15]
MNQSSNTPAADGNTRGAKPAGLGRVQGLSVIASVLLPIVAAYVVFYTGVGMPESTINQGALLERPVNVGQLQFQRPGAAPLQLQAEKPRWRYLILAGGECTAECEQLLYTSRQVHIRLGEKANRVERLLVTDTPLTDERQRKLHEEHPRLRLLQLDADALQQLRLQTAHANIADTRALLIDQQGFAMMAYDSHHSGNQLLKDIKRLLKYSYDK